VEPAIPPQDEMFCQCEKKQSREESELPRSFFKTKELHSTTILAAEQLAVRRNSTHSPDRLNKNSAMHHSPLHGTAFFTSILFLRRCFEAFVKSDQRY
jgi:hypothetical protein